MPHYNNVSCGGIRRIFFAAALFAAMILSCGVPASARDHKENHKRHAEMIREVQEFKIKYLIQEAEITKEQQPEFIRIYTELNNAKLNLFKTYRDNHKALKAKQSPTDEDYNKVSEEMAGAKSAEGALDIIYYKQLKKLLSPKQLYLMKNAEMKFNRKMMKMRDKKK